MSTFVVVMTAFSGISFLAYGISCLVSIAMRAEFERFGLARFRVLVGWLEFLCGSAQLLSWLFAPLGLLGSGGLFLLMAIGVIIRWRIGDRLWVTLPAIAYLVMNAYLFMAFLKP